MSNFVLPFMLVICMLGVFSSVPVKAAVSTSSKVIINVQGSQGSNSITAVDDKFSIAQGTPFINMEVGSNDTTVNSFLDKTSLTLLSQPHRGKAEVYGYYIRFSPDSSFSGQLQFEYKICNVQFTCDSALIFVDIIPTIPQPQPQPDTDTPKTGGNSVITIGLISSLTIFSLFWLIILRRRHRDFTVDS